LIFPDSFRQLLPLIVVMSLGTVALTDAGELKVLSNARLVNPTKMDGDSFFIDVSGSKLHIRLYYIDCPEISVTSKTDAERVREQMRYFGLSSAVSTVHYGKVAKQFSAKILSKPFTVYTTYANALGRSSKGRVYAFVVTAGGDDLAGLLLKNGLARTHGVGRKTPDGIPRDEMIMRLRDLETAAMLKRIGIWSASDPDRIAELRAEQRREDEKLKALQRQIDESVSLDQVVDPNNASKEELESIPGIGPKIAARIIRGRPYKRVDDLLKVKGIGPKKLEKITPYLTIKRD